METPGIAHDWAVRAAGPVDPAVGTGARVPAGYPAGDRRYHVRALRRPVTGGADV